MRILRYFTNYLKERRRNKRYNGYNGAKKYIEANNCPSLSEEDRKEIDRYWAKFHVKFNNYDWFRMYYNVTGIHDPRFIPHSFAREVLYKYYNRSDFAMAYADKNMFSTFLPQLKFPDMLGKRVNRRYYDNKGNYFGEEVSDSYIDALYNCILSNGEKDETKDNGHEIVIKVAVDSSKGQGVKRFTINSPRELDSAISSCDCDNIVIQRKITQHSFFKQFNPDSVNIMRITTWRVGNKVHILCPCVRFGIKGYYTDIAFVNGIEIVNAVKIDTNGVIDDHYVTIAGKRNALPKEYARTVPNWSSVIEAVTKGAMALSYFDIVGWDVTVDNNENVIILEYNIIKPGNTIYQFAHGPLAGDNTEQLLSFLVKDENRKLLPKCIRL